MDKGGGGALPPLSKGQLGTKKVWSKQGCQGSSLDKGEAGTGTLSVKTLAIKGGVQPKSQPLKLQKNNHSLNPTEGRVGQLFFF